MSKSFSKSNQLDPAKFTSLISDILTIKCHTVIRITDGPGDGGRDIHSKTPQGNWHLTQCKFHKDDSITCSSRDLSELPMAMTKLGYSKGLFATNAKISPQAKREFIDNYKQFELDFFYREIVINEIASSTVLRTLWSDGVNFRLMKNTWKFPFIIRKHEHDLPIVPQRMEKNSLPSQENLLQKIREEYPSLQIEFRTSHLTAEPFEPYRAPEPYTEEEGALHLLFATEALVSGTNLTTIANFPESLCKYIISWLGDTFEAFSVRVGSPHIVPLEGKETGEKVSTNIKPVSYIKTLTSCGEETNWIGANANPHWDGESDARVSEAEAIRLYNSELDICLQYHIFGRISPNSKATKLALREQTAIAWEKSVFALVPKWDSWPYHSIPEPDEKIEWRWDGKMLCGWHHPVLLSELRAFRSACKGDNFFLGIDENKVATHMLEIKNTLRTQSEIEIVSSSDARHMLALMCYDPLEEIEKGFHITGEVLHYPETIPSPISPKSRHFLCTIAFSISEENENILKERIKSLNYWNEKSYSFKRDSGHIIFEYIPKRIEFTNKSTFEILENIHIEAKSFLMRITEIGPVNLFKISTKEYWKKTYGITFGLNWTESLLPVYWKDGKPISNKKIAKEFGFEN